jgi:hypothetical protein
MTAPGVGRQALSNRATPPAATFRRGTRDALTNKVGGAAGSRFLKPSLPLPVPPSQFYSPNQAMPHPPGHPTISTVQKRGQTFISRQHEKPCAGALAPGPATAGPYRGVGPQPLSNRLTSPAWGFGTGKVRFRLLAMCGRSLWGVDFEVQGRAEQAPTER